MNIAECHDIGQLIQYGAELIEQHLREHQDICFIRDRDLNTGQMTAFSLNKMTPQRREYFIGLMRGRWEEGLRIPTVVKKSEDDDPWGEVYKVKDRLLALFAAETVHGEG